MRIWFVLVVCAALGADGVVFQGSAHRAGLAPVATGTAVVTGRVVDAVTGAPVPRARVELVAVARQSGRPRTVLSGDDGAFAFKGVAGAHTLTAERATYLRARYPAAGRSLRLPFPRLQVGDGQTVSAHHRR